LLRGLGFPKEIPEWIVKALRESQTGEAALHDEAISRVLSLQASVFLTASDLCHPNAVRKPGD
jgi:hypothetical protein